MRALTFNGEQVRLDRDYRVPVVGNDEALIRPTMVGICSTDIEIAKGYMGFKGVLGHEFVGVVESVGADVPERGKSLVGKRVAGTINCVCGRCDMCLGGLSNHCRNRTVLGIAGRDGCFADRFLLPAVNLLEVPDGVTDEVAVFTEPVAAACNILQQLRIEGKPHITILGDGRLGLLVAQVMAGLNASVRVIGKHDEKLVLCEKWGIKHRLLGDLIPRGDQDIVVDCTSSASGLETAMQLVRPRGKIVLKTTVAAQKDVDLSPIVINEIQLIGSRCGPFPDALSLLASETVDVIPMITSRNSLDDAEAAFARAASGAGIKTLIEI